MDKYTKPTVINNNDLAEGVYAASGTTETCYSVQARIHQRPEVGRDDYRIQVNAQHNAKHCCDGQLLTITFNQPVQYVSSQGQIKENNGNSIVIEYHYWNNPTDNIGLGDVVVKSSDGLSIMSCSMIDNDWQK